MFREIIAVYSDNKGEPINKLRRKNSEFINVKAGSTNTSTVFKILVQ
jgi:hypothetical protein